jgi:hypothetical protein
MLYSRRTVIIDNDADLGPMPAMRPPESGPPTPPVDRLPCCDQVRCGGAWHTIIYRPDGRLHFPHHRLQDLRREAARRKGGALVCRCAEVLWAWRRSIRRGTCYHLLPPNLCQEARDAHELHTDREKRRRQHIGDFAAGTGYEHPSLVVRLIDRLLRRYWGLPPSVTIAAGPSGIPGAFRLLIRDGQTAVMEYSLPRHWIKDVCQAGPVLYDGCLVLWRTPVRKPRQPHADYTLARLYPVRGHGGRLALEIDHVRVVRTAGGGFRAVESPHYVRPATALPRRPTAE